MKIKFLLLLIVLSAGSGQPLYAQTNDYFPLQVGNTWVFDLYEWPDILVLQDTISIIDSLEIDSKTYFLFDQYFTIHRLEDSVYLRTEEDQVYRYQDGREELWFDLSASEGDTWQIRTRFAAEDTLVPVTVTLVKKKFSFVLNNRTFENGYHFEFDFAVDYGWTYTLTPKFGCVFSEVISILPRKYIFRSGTINGIHYPDLVSSVDSKKKPEHNAINRPMLLVYPNPFNSSTRIVLNTPRAEGAIKPEIYIYDITGRKVKTFSIGPATTAQISWNGENDKGMVVPSGVYFVVFYFDNEHITKKVVFVR